MHRHTSPSPIRSLTPSRSFPGPSLSHHHSCLNYLSDPSMKRYMERIRGSLEDAQRASPHPAFTRSYSAPIAADLHRFSSSMPSFSSNFMRVSSPHVSVNSSADLPRGFHAERFAEGGADLPLASSSSSESHLRVPKNSRVSFATGMMYPRHLSRRGKVEEKFVLLLSIHAIFPDE